MIRQNLFSGQLGRIDVPDHGGERGHTDLVVCGNQKNFVDAARQNIKITADAPGKIVQQMLIENTEGFLEGHEANNVLLAGAGGTGKSSAVKALVNEYFDQGLRLVEVGKEQMEQLPVILQYIAGRGKRFILFIDDLSFEDFETEYKYMKSLLEGSVEKKPENVVFYATSNRRNIIQQKWKDRQTEHLDQEVHGIEAMNEKLSLSQRFGLTLTYPVPNQAQYLEIVRYLAQKQGITADKALEREAIQWSMEQKGFSGRSARQFILYYQQKKQ